VSAGRYSAFEFQKGKDVRGTGGAKRRRLVADVGGTAFVL